MVPAASTPLRYLSPCLEIRPIRSLPPVEFCFGTRPIHAASSRPDLKKALFAAHPASVDMTYSEHLAAALSFARTQLVASLACFVHGFSPFLFMKTGSSMIAELNRYMAAGCRHFLPVRLTAKAC